MELQGAAEDGVAREDQGDGRLGERGEAEEAAALDGAEGSGEEAGQDGGGDFEDVGV